MFYSGYDLILGGTQNGTWGLGSILSSSRGSETASARFARFL